MNYSSLHISSRKFVDQALGLAAGVALLWAAAGCLGPARQYEAERAPLTLAAGLAEVRGAAQAPVPPVAPQKPHLRILHGDAFIDNYYWLRNKGSPQVESYLKAEDAYTRQVMKPFVPLIEDLYREIISHIAENDETVPALKGRYLYWQRVDKGKNYPVYLRRADRPHSKAQVVLDQNLLAAGKPFLELGAYSLSDDGGWLLFATDETGARRYTLRFKDLKTGILSPERIERVAMAEWSASAKIVFYVAEDDANRPYRLYRHTIGKSPQSDVLVYEEKDGRFELSLGRTQSRAFLVATSESQLSTEVRLIDAQKPMRAPILVAPRADNVEYAVEHRGDELYIRVNDRGRNFRIVTAPLASPGKAHWKELRPHDSRVMLERLVAFSEQLVLEVRENGLPELEVYDFKAATTVRIAVPELDHSVRLDENYEPKTRKLRYQYQSLSTPKTIYEYDVDKGTSKRIKEDPVPGGFARSRYKTEYVFARAKDGAAIPLSIIYKKGTRLDGTAPLHLYGYGSYGASLRSTFSPARLVLLDRGVIYAVAHVRGGGEMGELWHEQGRLANKMNTFTDFIACAEHLIAAKYTSPSRLTIEGRSAGGLLMGVVTNLRPTLWKAVIAAMPFVDVVNTMNDPSLPSTITEYEEWGNPSRPQEYWWMRRYSPYDNIESKAYPSMLVRSSYNDNLVMYWEPAKYVARLRAMKTDRNPLLFQIFLDPAGHAGRSGRYEQYRSTAFDSAFLLWQNGVLSASCLP